MPANKKPRKRKYRYRRVGINTVTAIKVAERNLARLGKIDMILARRLTTTRSYKDEEGKVRTWTTNHEHLFIYGVNGTARIEGVCWGYGGEGPRGVHTILKQIGVPDTTATEAAFKAERLQTDGVDWRLTLDDRNIWLLTKRTPTNGK